MSANLIGYPLPLKTHHVYNIDELVILGRPNCANAILSLSKKRKYLNTPLIPSNHTK